jgi:polyphenol oxidase
MHTHFELRKQGPWSYICSPRLERLGVFHGFLMKPRDESLQRAAVEEAVSAFSFKSYVLMNQEHGDTVHTIKHGERPTSGDGIVLLEKQVAGIIKTADCLPVILYSESMQVVAIVHSGWRGTALGIARKAAQQMMALGVKAESMGALIGPGIGVCCYEVQEDVAGVFRAAGFTDPVIQRRNGLEFLDLKKANVQMLHNEGIKTIYDVGLCTSCRQDLFHSARRDKEPGRQINFVLLRS